MQLKEILHKIIEGMCPFLSAGVPDPYWELAQRLTVEVYGEKGLSLLELAHETYTDNKCRLHLLEIWEDGKRIPHQEIIARLEK
jgi:hypothetical protein